LLSWSSGAQLVIWCSLAEQWGGCAVRAVCSVE
jgi:hypothetical protein